MNGLLKQKKAVIALGAIGSVALLAAAWFLVIAPQQSKADDLDRQVTAAQSELAQRKVALANPAAQITVKAGDTYRLAKALPDDANMAGMILDLNRLAKRHKLVFTAITPSAPLAATGYIAQPVGVEVQGRFTDVSGFLGELRGLVRVQKHRLDARGRLYSTTNINLTEGDNKFPNVKAAVTIESYTFFAPTAAGTPADSSTSSTPSSAGTVAAGVTP
jgi:Tfp pilus assembly protein PilO